MKEMNALFDRIAQRVSINLREMSGFNVDDHIRTLVPIEKLSAFYAFYGISPHHPLSFDFRNSCLGGSYFLGKCSVNNSILYKSDIRGDELKKRGDLFPYDNRTLPVHDDETIRIRESLLVKTLVHCFSHDPECLEDFFINDTISTHYANIHGSPSEGCFFAPFSTVDLTTTHDCIVGPYSYVQAGEIDHRDIPPGTIWVKSSDFNFHYRYPEDILAKYVQYLPGNLPTGLFMDFINNLKEEFSHVFEVVNISSPKHIPETAYLDRFAVIRPKTTINDNVLVAQRAYLNNSWLGVGANAQENCYIINSRLEGYNVTAHGAKIIGANLSPNVFVGFNSFLHGTDTAPLRIGQGCIVMPHTIIDLQQPLDIPGDHLVWGFISGPEDLAEQSIPFSELETVTNGFTRGKLRFEGSGKAFTDGFRARIHHILEANGAFFDGKNNIGHAKRNQSISFNTIQPYPEGDRKGLYPTIRITT